MPPCEFELGALVQLLLWLSRAYSRPVRTKMIKIKSTRPNPPLGKYPQFALCGHVGNAPTRSKIRITMSMVLI
jgi:hypothetical protein